LDKETLNFLKIILKRDSFERQDLDNLFQHPFIVNNRLERSKMVSFSHMILYSYDLSENYLFPNLIGT